MTAGERWMKDAFGWYNVAIITILSCIVAARAKDNLLAFSVLKIDGEAVYRMCDLCHEAEGRLEEI
jgi:hypothetical protein